MFTFSSTIKVKLNDVEQFKFTSACFTRKSILFCIPNAHCHLVFHVTHSNSIQTTKDFFQKLFKQVDALLIHAFRMIRIRNDDGVWTKVIVPFNFFKWMVNNSWKRLNNIKCKWLKVEIQLCFMNTRKYNFYKPLKQILIEYIFNIFL